MKLYGIQGRMISGIAGIAGILTALAAAAQQAALFSIIPERYGWILPTVSVIALFLTLFSERVQGGASSPEVRAAAQQSDAKNEREALNK